ncbi:MAG: metallophosphoesterase [Lachnospiraceae bacterium]|nr:metallophosphoesterase [Lachnospiraceae bacterium]
MPEKKVLVISDTHGRTDNLDKILPLVKPLDQLIHLGDVGRDVEYIEVIAECPCCFVSGNNDFYSTLPRERLIKLNGVPVFLTHGHYYYVNSRKDYVRSAAIQRGARIALFGHTHVPYLEEDNTILVANPGSLSLPRQADACPTYMLLYIAEDGSFRVEQCRV